MCAGAAGEPSRSARIFEGCRHPRAVLLWERSRRAAGSLGIGRSTGMTQGFPCQHALSTCRVPYWYRRVQGLRPRADGAPCGRDHADGISTKGEPSRSPTSETPSSSCQQVGAVCVPFSVQLLTMPGVTPSWRRRRTLTNQIWREGQSVRHRRSHSAAHPARRRTAGSASWRWSRASPRGCGITVSAGPSAVAR